MLLKLPTIIFQFQIVSPICYCLTFRFVFPPLLPFSALACRYFIQFCLGRQSQNVITTGTYMLRKKNGFKVAAVTEISVGNSLTDAHTHVQVQQRNENRHI